MQNHPQNIALSMNSFGMLLPERTWTSDSASYRYGFNTQERDDEIYGEGNSTNAEYWQYDSRLGRRWNVDPITYPWQSSYATNNNCPIYFSDPMGLKGESATADGPTKNKPDEGSNPTDFRSDIGLRRNQGITPTTNGFRNLASFQTTQYGTGLNRLSTNPTSTQTNTNTTETTSPVYGPNPNPNPNPQTESQMGPSPSPSLNNNIIHNNVRYVFNFGTEASILGEAMILGGNYRSNSLYQQGFRNGINGNYQLTGRNLTLFGNQPMSTLTKPVTNLGYFGRTLSVGGTMAGGVSLGFDAISYYNGDMSGARFTYHAVGTGTSLYVGYMLGGPYGAAVGGIFALSEFAYDYTKPLRREISHQTWQVGNALRGGWRPRF